MIEVGTWLVVVVGAVTYNDSDAFPVKNFTPGLFPKFVLLEKAVWLQAQCSAKTLILNKGRSNF